MLKDHYARKCSSDRRRNQRLQSGYSVGCNRSSGGSGSRCHHARGPRASIERHASETRPVAERQPRYGGKRDLVAVEESGVAALQDPDLAAFELFSGPRGNFMYYWYASLCVVVQGFRNLKLVDPRVDALLASPNVKALRRCWNGVFHFQPDYFSAKLLEPMQAPDFIGWVRELMEAFRAYFAREIKPVESRDV